MVVPLSKLDFDLIANHYYPILTRNAEIMCHGDHTTAEEVVQDTMITAWSKREQVQPGNFDKWINTILTNRIRDAYRHGRKKNSYTYLKRIPADFDQAAPEPNDGELYDTIISTINTLPTHHRDVCKLTIVDNMEQQEIADKLKIPLGTVQSRQARSKAMLKDKLKDLNNG